MDNPAGKLLRQIRARGVMVSLWQQTYGKLPPEFEVAIGTRVVQMHTDRAAAEKSFSRIVKAIVVAGEQQPPAASPGGELLDGKKGAGK